MKLCSLAFALLASLAACGETDIVARRLFEQCIEPEACETAPPGVCQVATVCNADALVCDAPVTEPSVLVGDGCTMREPTLSFRHALCSCGDFVSEHELVVEHVVTADQGAALAPLPGASIAINGNFNTTANVRVEGELIVSGNLELLEDAVADADSVRSETGRPECDCSATSHLSSEDADALVPSESAPGFDPALLEDVQSDSTVALACGSYRVSRIAGGADLHLTISGHVVLLVEGDIALDAGMDVSVEEGGLFELIVLGNVRLEGPWLLQGDPGQTRVYALGSGTIDLNMQTLISGPLYAPRAELVTRDVLTVLGPIFVRRAAPGADVLVRYNSALFPAIACDAL